MRISPVGYLLAAVGEVSLGMSLAMLGAWAPRWFVPAAWAPENVPVFAAFMAAIGVLVGATALGVVASDHWSHGFKAGRRS